jgi:4-hydroxythreonine-4-phosphate dehydrogenase
MQEQKIIIGISQGDINGIGPEIILKTVIEPELLEICTPVVFSSPKTISYYRKTLGLDEFNYNPMRDFSQLSQRKTNVFVCYDEEVVIEMGKPTLTGAKYAQISLEKATQALADKQIQALVTAPVNKSTLYSESFKYTGHTEYLGARLGGEPLMILCNEEGLRVALVTGHVAVKDVTALLTTERISKKIRQLNESLQKDFGIRKPKIAVLGLNPHAGDGGLIGVEDRDIIVPAIESTKINGLVYGPYSADGFFGSGAYRQFDGILAMYHDQGLIPFKTLSFNEGVNYTAGLSGVRTSPDHGTAFEIAGKNVANPDSFKKALYMAIDIVNHRKISDSISENPLPFSHIKRER